MLDVVFLHGLDGHPKKSWTAGKKDFWPRWLAEDVSGVAVWSVGYDAWSSGWRGHAIPMEDRMINVLASLQLKRVGERPLVFVTHSMGGLIVKEALLYAAYGGTEFASFAEMTRAVVFLGTPHNGSGLTKTVDALGKIYRGTDAVKDLRSNGAHLRQLSTRYQNWVHDSTTGIQHLVFFETRPTKGFQVVDAASADPALPKVQPVGVDADHVAICKPSSRDALVYGRTRNLVALVAAAAATATGDTEEIPSTPRNLAKLRDRWAYGSREGAGGDRQTTGDLDFQLHSALRDSIAAWLRQPGSRAPLAEALSGFAATGGVEEPITVQAKLVGPGDPVRAALEDLWSVSRTAEEVLADGAANLRFEIRCRRRAASTVRTVVDRWRPAQGGDDDAVADFTARLSLTTDPSPRSEAMEMLTSGVLRVSNPLGWIDRWTERLASAVSEGRRPADLADELFSDLTTLRLSPPKDCLSQGIVVLTDTFAPPAEVTPGDYLAGAQPKPSHVVDGFFADRDWQVGPAAEHLELWLDSVESAEADIGRRLPVYWFEGRSGCGKSVLMLQTLARIRQTNRGMMLWLGNDVEELPEAVSFALTNAEPGDQTIIVIDDGFSPAAQGRSGEHWRDAVRALSTARNQGRQLPVIVTCGPSEQRSAFRSAFLDDVEVTARRVNEQLDTDHAAELERWFTARTSQTLPAHLASSNVLMVQRFFQYGTGASLESFARRFKARLEGMERSSRVPAFIAKLLAVNRLYAGLPAASLRALTDAERDALTQLTEGDKHIAVSADSGRGGVWLAHPHLADALFQGWFGERDAHQSAGVLRDAIIECGLVGESPAERAAPLTALRLAVARSHTAAFQGRLDPALLPVALAAAYETLARSAVGIGLEDLPAWIRLEQALPGVVLSPTPRALGSAAIADPALTTDAWIPTAHALVGTLHPGDQGAEELLDALRRRIGAGGESSSGAGAVAARVAALTGSPLDLDALTRWLGDPGHWTDSGWPFAYQALGSLTQSDTVARIALAWLQSESTVANPGWGYVLERKLFWVGDRARDRVLETAAAWLVHPDAATNPAWCHVALTLLRETRGELLAEVERASVGWLSDERSHRTLTWHYLYRRMHNEVAPSSRRERAQLISLGKEWLQSPNSFSTGWPIVFDALYSTLGAEERDELLRAVTDWVLDETHFSDSNWINVCTGLMRHLGPREHALVVALATTWVREPMHQFLRRWDKSLERLISVVGSTGRDDLVGIGMQWLREWIDQDDPRWGSVAQTLMRATDGTDQTELLGLVRRWIDTASAQEDPLWPVVVTHFVERTPGAHQAPVFETAGRWLKASVHRSGQGWTRLLELLVDADHDREAVGESAADRLVGHRRFRDVDDWGNVYALVLGSDLAFDRGELVEAGLEFLRTRSLDDRVDRSQVVGGLLSVLDGSGRAELVRLEFLWLWNRHNWRYPSWNRVFQIMMDAAPDERGELRQLGLQWLKNISGNGGWGWVLEHVHPLTTGQEREQLAAFLWNWFADPVNRDSPASSKAIECAVALSDTAALDADEVYALGLDWLTRRQNFAGRRWSFVFRALGERHSAEHSPELADLAVAWLSDSRSRADVGWPFVLSSAADLADDRHLAELHRLAESWLADPVNWGDQNWGHTTGTVSRILTGLSDPDVAAAGRWLALPLTRRSRTWRYCWRPVAPRLEPEVRDAAISGSLDDPWTRSSRQWGFRYLDAAEYLDLSATPVGEQVVEWCSRRRWSKDPVWPHVITLGLRVADPSARAALTRLAEAWLLEPDNTIGRGTVEAALLEPIEFGDLAPSQTRTAVVSNIVDYGAFVNLGGHNGLIHKSEMAYGQADHRKVLQIGQHVTVRVLRVDSDTGKIALSLRLQSPVDPHLDAARASLPPLDLATCSPGTQLDGVVTGVVEYGVFVDVGRVTGLAHISRIPGSADPRTRFTVGQHVRCLIVSFDPAKERLSLSLNAHAPAARDRAAPKGARPRISLGDCSEGDLMEGVVTRVMPYGVLLDVGGVSGLLHNREMESGGPRSRAQVARPGHRLRVRVRRIDQEKGRLDFSLRGVA
nr:S1 RNA-binding domain-containing protein [Streptomyces sp. NBC_00899]